MYKIIALCLLVGGCSTIAPSNLNFPTPPEILMREPLPLQTLSKQSQPITVSATKTRKLFKRSKAGLESNPQYDE